MHYGSAAPLDSSWRQARRPGLSSGSVKRGRKHAEKGTCGAINVHQTRLKLRAWWCDGKKARNEKPESVPEWPVRGYERQGSPRRWFIARTR